VGKVTNCTSSGPFGKSLHSSASAQSAKPCHSQDIFGHAILLLSRLTRRELRTFSLSNQIHQMSSTHRNFGSLLASRAA
jgi:hypothetical protein